MQNIYTESCPLWDRGPSRYSEYPACTQTVLSDKITENTKEGYVTWLMSHSLLTFEQAESVFYFQMNGCLSINRLMLRNHCNDWKQIQTTIDKFIKAGLESFLIHDQREENASDNFCSKISPTVTASSTLR